VERKTNLSNQHRFVDAKKKQGLKRLVMWVRPEDVSALKLAAQQPHSLAKLRKQVEADVTANLKPQIINKVEGMLLKRTNRAMLAQKRAQARKSLAGSNRPPNCVRFTIRPPAAQRAALKDGGWLYDPVAAVWHLPDDPATFGATERLLDSMEALGVERLVNDVDTPF
jgi:hypothetical protein